MQITIIFEWFIILMWKYLNFELFCFYYSVVNVRSAFTEAQPGSSLTALCFEIVCLLLRKIVERGFQILTLMNFHEPLEIKCNFQWPSSSDSPLPDNTKLPLKLQCNTVCMAVYDVKSTYNKSFEYFLIFQTQDPNLDLLKRIFEILLNKLCLTKEKYCNFWRHFLQYCIK